MTNSALRQQAHHLVDSISAHRLQAAVGLLEGFADPVLHKLAEAPLEDELISEREEAQAAAAANGPWISMEEMMSEMGITQADLDLQRGADQAVQPAR